MMHTTKRLLNFSSSVLTRKQNDILLAAAVIMVSYGASLVLGVFKQRLMGAYFFHCCAADLDAFQAAFRIPDLVFQTIVVGSLTTAGVPIFAQRFQKSTERGYESAINILALLLVIMTVATIVVLIFANQLASLTTANFSQDQIKTMANLMRIIFASQLLFLFSNWAGTLLQTMKRFLAPALAPVIYNVGIITGIILLAPKMGIYGPALGVALGALLHFSVQMGVLFTTKMKITFDFKDLVADISEIWHMSWPRLLTQGLTQIENNLVTYFASSLITGSIFLFDLATGLRQIPIQMVGLAIGQAAFPSLSEYAHGNPAKFKRIAQNTFLQMLYLVLPITAVLLILRIPIVRLAFGSSSFPWAATKETAYTLGIFTIAIPFLAVSQLLLRSYYAYKNTRTPLLIYSVGIFIFGLLGYFAVFGIAGYKLSSPGISIVTPWLKLNLFSLQSPLSGLAYAVVIATLFRSISIFWFIRHQVIFNLVKLRRDLTGLLIATLVMIISLWIPFQFLDKLVFDTTRVIPLIALTVTTTSIGLIVYIVTCHLLDISSQHEIWQLVLKFPGFKSILSKVQTIVAPNELS